MTPPTFCPPVALPFRPRTHRRPRHPSPQVCTTSQERPSPPVRLSNPENVVLRPAVHDSMVLAASRTVRTIPEMSLHIAQLRRHRLSLLLADLVARVRCEKPTASQSKPLEALLLAVDRLSSQLLADADTDTAEDTLPALRAEIRRILWDLRLAVDPLRPSEWLRTSLEVARSSFLDIPGRVAGQNGNAADEAIMRAEMYALMVENILLEELRSLRVLERQMYAAVVSRYRGRVEAELRVATDACALLGIDDYRVRGKTRLADAVARVRDELAVLDGPGIAVEVEQAIEVLHNALVKSLEMDLSVRRPAGQAMLLRPRMDDIPNFAVVNENILRGGQPSSRGLEWLSNYGVTLVIDLRGSDRKNQWEMPKCKVMRATGKYSCENDEGGVKGEDKVMRFCNIPIEDFCTPTVEQVYEFIDLVDAVLACRDVVFVHCKAGIGRTGTLVACWRIFHGASPDDALARERLYTEGGGGLRQEKFVREFAEIQEKKSGNSN